MLVSKPALFPASMLVIFLSCSSGSEEKTTERTVVPRAPAISLREDLAGWPSDGSPVLNAARVVFRTGDTASGHRFFSLHWGDRTIDELPGLTAAEAKALLQCKVSAGGVVAFELRSPEGILFVRDADTTIQVKAPFFEANLSRARSETGPMFSEKRTFPLFEVSPDGRRVLAYATRDFAFSDSSSGTVHTEFLVASLIVGEHEFQPAVRETVVTEKYFADVSFQRFFVGWDPDDPEVSLFSDYDSGQLYGTSKNLWRFHAGQRDFTLLSGDVEETLDVSGGGELVLSTNNDRTCCSGTNYTDNLLILRNLREGWERILFHEWTLFGNADKAEEHVPTNGMISPDARLVASTISDFKNWNATSSDPEPLPEGVKDSLTGGYHVWVAGIDGNDSRVFGDLFARGWLDNRTLLASPITEIWRNRRWHTNEGELVVLDVSSGARMPLLKESGTFIAIQR
ncbi:MAG: hypothetical protein HRF44_12715 [Ignavibacterium sp.]|jgi:hypothetical protein